MFPLQIISFMMKDVGEGKLVALEMKIIILIPSQYSRMTI